MSRNRNIMKRIENSREYIKYRDYLTEIALNAFEWHNIPEGVNVEYLEKTLLYKGQIAFFAHKTNGALMALSYTNAGTLNIYGDPIKWQVVGANGFNQKCDTSNSVIMYNNANRKATYPVIKQFAQRLAQIELTSKQNLAQQSLPVLLLADERQRASIEARLNAQGDYTPTVIGNKSIAEDAKIEVQTTGIPLNLSAFDIHKHEVWNEAMTFLGVNNTNQMKKERLISDEVNANDDQVESSRNSFLIARNKAIDEVNKMFGTDMYVTFRESDEVKLQKELDAIKITLAEAEAEKLKAEAVKQMSEASVNVNEVSNPQEEVE